MNLQREYKIVSVDIPDTIGGLEVVGKPCAFSTELHTSDIFFGLDAPKTKISNLELTIQAAQLGKNGETFINYYF
jgi:hypothetical protein